MGRGLVTLGVPGVLGGGAAWTPSDLDGLTAWFDFSDISTLFQDSAGTTPVTSDADPIGLVTNKGSAGDAVQTTTAAKPTYKVNIKNSLAASLWDGGDTLLTASAQFIGLDGTFTVLVVARDTLADNGKRHLLHNNAGGGDFLHVYLSVRVRGHNTIGGNATDTPGTGYTSDTWFIAQSLRSATGIEARMNAVADGATAIAGTPRSAADALAIGSNATSNENWAGYICEVLLYNSLLSSENLALVLAYMNDKWTVY